MHSKLMGTKKTLLLFLLFFVVLVDAMEKKATIIVQKVSDKTNYVVVSEQLPNIEIQKCAICSDQTMLRCERCKFTYYCSPECQKSDWLVHKSQCKEIKKVHSGDIEQMKNIFFGYIKKALKTRKSEFVQQASYWYARTILRVKQDIACSKESPVQAALDRIQKDYNYLANPLIEQGICTANDLLNDEAFNNAITWVEKITKENKLVSPVKIREQGLGFLFPSKNGMTNG